MLTGRALPPSPSMHLRRIDAEVERALGGTTRASSTNRAERLPVVHLRGMALNAERTFAQWAGGLRHDWLDHRGRPDGDGLLRRPAGSESCQAIEIPDDPSMRTLACSAVASTLHRRLVSSNWVRRGDSDEAEPPRNR